MIFRSVLLILTFGTIFNVNAKPQLSFYQYVKQLEANFIEQGGDADETKSAFKNIKQFKKAIIVQQRERNRNQSLDFYLSTFVNQQRIEKAQELYKKHIRLLTKIEKKYQIQPRFIIALWGVANDFSSDVDGYNSLNVLSSLAHANNDDDTYQAQIYSVLELLKTDAVGFSDIKSNWAGKIGLFNLNASQYLSSYQDADNDGKSDIWHSKSDSFATTANFLLNNGWNSRYTWGRQVILPKGFDVTSINLKEYKSLSQWSDLGIKRINHWALPSVELKAKLIAPDGFDGRLYLTYKNFESLVDLNDSIYKAIAVAELSDKIKL